MPVKNRIQGAIRRSKRPRCIFSEKSATFSHKMKQDVLLKSPQAPGLGEVAELSAEIRRARAAACLDMHVVCGRQGVLALQPLLQNLSRQTGQVGAMDWLYHFINSPDSLEKTPYLVLAGDDRSLIGALLLYEYRFAGVGTRVFATDDILGTRTIVAPDHLRIAIAEAAVRHLMRDGAVMALASIDTSIAPPAQEKHPDAPYSTAFRTRTAPRYLELQSTIEATLARMGDDTRRNFRRYRRRAETELGAEFLPHVTITRQEYFDLNRASTNPAPGDVACWRHELFEQSRTDDRVLLCGLRGRDGQWLSLVGGRRNGTTTEIDRQLNRAGLPHSSLCTAMRAFLLEHEIARGTKRLVFEGGTPHPMRFAFTPGQTVDLLAIRRHSARAWLLRHFADRIFPQKNFLRAALKDFSSDPPQEARDERRDLANAA